MNPKIKKIYKRIFEKPIKSNYSFFLFGPRGTGKTSWTREKIPNGLYLDLLETSLYINLLANPQSLENLIPKGFTDWIIIDEVQKIPKLLDEVHRLIENYGYKFVLTGSSARSLKKKGVNLLAGRALTYNMFPLTAIELKEDFDIKKSLLYGHLPSVFSEGIDREHYLSTYVQTYLKEEVMQEGLTRNLAAFSRFLEIASYSQGSVLNYSEIARETNTNRKVIQNYFEILEDLLLGQKIEVFSKKAKRKVISHPKFYFFDVGIYRSIRPKGPLDLPEEAEGVAIETLVYQEIRAINNYYNLGFKIYYWRTVTQNEVDFILYGPKGLIAIEVKRAKTITSKHISSLKKFYNEYPISTLYLFYGGTRKQRINNIQIIPIDQALIDLPEILNIK